MIARIKSRVEGIRFLLQNLIHAIKIKPFPGITANGLTFRGYQKEDVKQIAEIYAA